MAHWTVDAITCLPRLRAHSTRGFASSWVLDNGALLADICRAAGWVTPNTFARFYSLHVEPVPSCVLTSNGEWHREALLRVGLRHPLTFNSPKSSLSRQTLSSPPALRSPDVAEHPVSGLTANEFLKTGVRLVPI